VKKTGEAANEPAKLPRGRKRRKPLSIKQGKIKNSPDKSDGTKNLWPPPSQKDEDALQRPNAQGRKNHLKGKEKPSGNRPQRRSRKVNPKKRTREVLHPRNRKTPIGLASDKKVAKACLNQEREEKVGEIPPVQLGRREKGRKGKQLLRDLRKMELGKGWKVPRTKVNFKGESITIRETPGKS